MGSQTVNLAVVVNNPSNAAQFLLTKQTPPPKFSDPEYDSFQDSHLWDLPSSQLSLLHRPSASCQVQIEPHDDSLVEFLNRFDLDAALNQILELIGFDKVKWNFSKVVEEPDFGPGIPIRTVYIHGELESYIDDLKDGCKWMSTKGCEDLLLEVKPRNDRIGPLVVLGILNDSLQYTNANIPPSLRSQEYPPGVKLVPMKSRTAKPFHTTNLVVFAPPVSCGSSGSDDFIAGGDALIVDPGCNFAMYKELEQIVTALPRKLIVFVTHHHHDHVDGLSVVQKCNPDAVLVGHKNTIFRIKKDDWSLGHISVSGSEEISIGGQRWRPISAPGHTDGHMALLHVSTNSLIVGDHCVGQGSALLDITAGGNMDDYFQSTYKFMEISPHVLIPMHGRLNMWPKHMLCGYLKNRRNREATILKAIEQGAKTLYDIVSYTYAGIDRNLWIHAASNVRLHVDHLSLQNKLPEDFSLENFKSSIAEFASKSG